MKLDKKFYVSFLRYFTDRNKIVDLECRDGKFLELLKAEGKEVYGICRDGDCVRVCREKGYLCESFFRLSPKR